MSLTCDPDPIDKLRESQTLELLGIRAFAWYNADHATPEAWNVDDLDKAIHKAIEEITPTDGAAMMVLIQLEAEGITWTVKTPYDDMSWDSFVAFADSVLHTLLSRIWDTDLGIQELKKERLHHIGARK